MVKTVRFTQLDFIRGLAALLVTAGHLRHLLFDSSTRLNEAGIQISLPWKVFYGLTGLSHEAVIVFFALSGFLVGGKVLSDLTDKRFSWPLFVLRRLTRLWIVILPALLLTLAFDLLGSQFALVPVYQGGFYEIYSSGPTLDEPANHSLSTFLGNVLFLQKIYVPVFGSNGPLWSLANEFWYYVLFTSLFWIGLSRPRLGPRAATVVVILFVAWMIPSSYWSGAFIWVSGALAAWASRQADFSRYFVSNVTRLAAAVLVGACLLISKMAPHPIGGLVLGLAVAATLPVVARLPSMGRTFDALSLIHISQGIVR